MRLFLKNHTWKFWAFFIGILSVHTVATTYYVDINSPNPTPPYANWATAATNIQNALGQTANSDLVLVKPGIYFSSGYTAPDGTLSTVVVSNSVTLESMNGPAVTSIDGSNARRCIYLTNGAVLIGFTLTNGNASAGGGAYGLSSKAMLINCYLLKNQASGGGGGAYDCSLSNCLVVGNKCPYYGGGANFCTLTDCVLSNNTAPGGYGGGVYVGMINNCLFSSNNAYTGGGAAGGVFNDCLFIGNSASYGGAVMSFNVGASPVTIVNSCTISGNTASVEGGGVAGNFGAGINAINPTNCIVYGNYAPTGSNYYANVNQALSMHYCCTAPLPTNGFGNITNAPLFVNPAAGDYHLQSNSPCINAGNNAYVTVTNDLDGNPRIVGGTVDIGAYEYQTPTSVISYAWLQQYGLPTDGSVDFADLDGTAFDVYQDWVAGLNPTNSTSVLAMLTPTAQPNTNGIAVTWQSVTGISYLLQRSTNLPIFVTLQNNISGQTNTTSFTDTSATNGFPYFYRVGVMAP